MQDTRKSTISEKVCSKCNQKGLNLYHCNGCQNGFCLEHLVKHRDELDNQLISIGQECTRLHQNAEQKDTKQNILTHPLSEWINEWQQQLYSAHQTKDYSEIELTEWSQKLMELRELFDKPIAVQEINDGDYIPLIKIIQEEKSNENLDEKKKESDTDRFQTIAGLLSLSDEDHVVAYNGGVLGNYGSVLSFKRYSSGTHTVRFRFEYKVNNPLFVGVISESEPFIPRTYRSPSAYGWRDINFTVNKGQSINNSTNISNW